MKKEVKTAEGIVIGHVNGEGKNWIFEIELMDGSILKGEEESEYKASISLYRKYMKLEEQKRKDEKKNIKKYANLHLHSDIEPFEVLRKISDKTVEIRLMESIAEILPSNFQLGGFSAHCIDNHNQKYTYKSCLEREAIRIRWSDKKQCWKDKHGRKYLMSDQPEKFYDYNF